MEGSQNAGDATTEEQSAGGYTTGEPAGPYGGTEHDPDAVGSGTFATQERQGVQEAERGAVEGEGGASAEGDGDGDGEAGAEGADDSEGEDGGDALEGAETGGGEQSGADEQGDGTGDADETGATLEGDDGTTAGSGTDADVETNAGGAEVAPADGGSTTE